MIGVPKRQSPRPAPLSRSGFALMDMLGFSDTESVEYADPAPPQAPPPSRPVRQPRPERVPTTPPPAESPSSPSIFDLLPRLADLRRGGDSENTGTLVERLWEATDSYQPETSWIARPDETLGGQANRWRTAGILLVVALATVAAVAVRNSQVPEQPVIVQTPQATIAEAHGSITEARTVADLIVNPGTSGEDLSNAAVTLTALDSSARALSAHGATLLEDPLQEAVGEALTRAATLGTTSGRRLGDALTYRLVFARAFDLPELPSDADTVEVADIGFDVAAMISDTERSLERLPSDRVLNEHRAQAESTLTTIEALTPDYLQALRDGDLLAARGYANQLRDAAADIHAALLLPLRQVADQVYLQLDDYAAELSKAENALNTP